MSESNVARLTALGVNVQGLGIKIADGKYNYTEKTITEAESNHWYSRL